MANILRQQIRQYRKAAARRELRGGPYEAGYDCGKNGPNGDNCHFRWFSSPHSTSEWERGKRVAENGEVNPI